ncbi:MAG TPA: tripartite tricarboxylate transporter substrate binding protein [Burkholderiales bacterium]
MKMLCAAVVALAVTAHAQPTYPTKPITFVVPFAAGSATDQIARAVAQDFSAQGKQPVVTDNKAGANGFIAAQQVAKAAPDGYTVFVTTNTTQAANQHLYKKLPYDAVKDFTPVTALGRGGNVLVVRPTLETHTVGELIKLAKTKPGQLSFGSGSSASRVSGELFQQMAGVKLLHVPYKSNPLALNDLLGGQIDMMFTDTATGLPQVKAGKVRALGMTGPKRSPLAPDVPTIDEAGVKGYELTYWFAAYLPAKAPQALVERVHAMLVAATKSEAAQTFYRTTGTDVFTTTPQELAQFQSAESEKWGRVIKAAGIEPE